METNVTTLDVNYCYSVKELAFVWNLSRETITRIFEEEDGVLAFQTKRRRRGARLYRSLRIPGKVALRVQNRMTVVVPD
jgi:hypothetical protein